MKHKQTSYLIKRAHEPPDEESKRYEVNAMRTDCQRAKAAWNLAWCHYVSNDENSVLASERLSHLPIKALWIYRNFVSGWRARGEGTQNRR